MAERAGLLTLDTNPLHISSPVLRIKKGTRGLTFPDVDSLLEFVTKRWRECWIPTDINNKATLGLLLRQPFFMLLTRYRSARGSEVPTIQ